MNKFFKKFKKLKIAQYQLTVQDKAENKQSSPTPLWLAYSFQFYTILFGE